MHSGSLNTEYAMLGDSSLCVTISHEISEEANDAVLRLTRILESLGIPGIEEVQPAYSSLCVHFDPRRLRADWVQSLVSEAIKRDSSRAQADRNGFRTIDIPVIYGGPYGPDLEWASSYLGIPEEEIVRRHAAPLYRVYMIGFTPGFPYLGGMDETIALPRLENPRTRVPAGSVGIAGNQTGVYPWETPGGWRIIGRTHVPLFDPYRDEPSLLRPGDFVRFVPATSTPGEDHQLPKESRRDMTSHEPASVPGFEVLHPGFLSLVVDSGRYGYRKLGVPISGAADQHSYNLANELCGNHPGKAAIEITLMGPTFKALTDITVAVTGAAIPIHVAGQPAPMNQAIRVRRGQEVKLGSISMGCRAYLAVSGGISVPPVMGSRSTYLRGNFGGFLGRSLKAGDIVHVGPAPEHQFIAGKTSRTGTPIAQRLKRDVVLRVFKGPEGDDDLLDALCQEEYTVRPESDRMGVRFEGQPIGAGKGDILSSPVVPGTIQLPSDGRPVLLLRDAQTTGGYRRIACVISADLPLASQLWPGAKVRFRQVHFDEAIEALAACS